MRAYLQALFYAILFVASCCARVNAESGMLNEELPRGQKGRGADISRESPGLEQAILNYLEAKLVYDQAKILVEDAEKEVEIARKHKLVDSKQRARGNDDDEHKPKQQAVGNRPGLDEPREDKPHINDAPDYDETAASSYVTSGDEIIENSIDETPSICAKDMNEAESTCAENLPICKYKRIMNPHGDFVISAELADGEDDTKCIRRCDAKYGLTPEHCGEGLDCITEVVTCGDCDILSDDGPCQYFI